MPDPNKGSLVIDMNNLNEKFLTLEKECQNIAAFIKGFAP